jgi:glycosyltransferase involved in cell wall biosynthesis
MANAPQKVSLTPNGAAGSRHTAETAPKNILVIHANNDFYGAEKILFELLRNLDPKRFRPIVVLPRDTQQINRLSPELEKCGIEYHFLDLGVLRRRYFKIWALPRFAIEIFRATSALTRLVREKDIALIHSNTNTVLPGAFAARRTKRPHVWSIHELLVEPAMVRSVLHFLVPRLSTQVVTVSAAVRDHMLKDAPQYADRFVFIRGAIDVQPFAHARGREQVRKEWGIGDGEILIGMAGRVARWKGQSVFAEAAKLLLQKHQNVKFAAVGGVFETDVFYMDQFKRKVRDLRIESSFIINDFRTDMPDVFAAYDIFVLPSTWPEPFGLVLLEAMASSKPVVATAPGGPSEIVVEGETGYLVQPSSPEEIAAAVDKLLPDPQQRRRMGEAGRERVSRIFALPRYVREFEELYARLLGMRTPVHSE